MDACRRAEQRLKALHEPPRQCGARFKHGDGEWPAGLIALDRDRDAQPFAPDALGKFCHVTFAAVELVLAIFGAEQEPSKSPKWSKTRPSIFPGFDTDPRFTA